MKLAKRFFPAVVSSALLTATAFATSATAAPPTSYKNMFISYFSPANVRSAVAYASGQGINQFIVWDVQGDVNPQSDAQDSLLYNLKHSGNGNPNVTAYFENWGVYNQSPLPDGSPKALPLANYAIPGSIDSGTGEPATNADLTAKLPLINTLAYSFLEAQTTHDNVNTKEIGTVYFTDPWADLLPTDAWCLKDPMGQKVCGYAAKMSKKPETFAQSAKMGNFEAFAQLPKKYPNLKTEISIGGYGHDATFESMFGTVKMPDGTVIGTLNSDEADNFVNSIVAIMNQYHINGVDLDYENQQMTWAQSESFYRLVYKLNNALDNPQQFITITVPANPEYLLGDAKSSSGQLLKQGYAPDATIMFKQKSGPTHFVTGDVLANLSKLTFVKAINLMTYDFHGAFDYNTAGTGKTGFLANVYQTPPSGQSPAFSMQASAEAAEKAGVQPGVLGLGVPTYGRSVAGIPDVNDGFQQVIPSSAIIPTGNADGVDCNDSITATGKSACTGMFDYSYIVSHLLKEGFNAPHDWTYSGKSNGTTAFAPLWTPQRPHTYTLTINNMKNQGAAVGNLGFTVTVKNAAGDSYGPTSWQNPGSSKTYTPTAIEGKSGLQVYWADYNGQLVSCNLPAITLNRNLTIDISLDGSTAPVKGVCKLAN